MSMSYSGKLEKNRKYVKPVLICPPGRTKQSFAKACDINEIVARYQRTGLLDHVRANPGVFEDVSQIADFQGMVSKLRFAQESFELLPADLRKRFHHDPSELIEFVSDDSNRPEAIRLGILPKPPKAKVEPIVVPVEPPAPVPAKAEKTKSSSKAAPAD